MPDSSRESRARARNHRGVRPYPRVQRTESDSGARRGDEALVQRGAEPASCVRLYPRAHHTDSDSGHANRRESAGSGSGGGVRGGGGCESDAARWADGGRGREALEPGTCVGGRPPRTDIAQRRTRARRSRVTRPDVALARRGRETAPVDSRALASPFRCRRRRNDVDAIGHVTTWSRALAGPAAARTGRDGGRAVCARTVPYDGARRQRARRRGGERVREGSVVRGRSAIQRGRARAREGGENGRGAHVGSSKELTAGACEAGGGTRANARDRVGGSGEAGA
ncbi:hypothetical protein B0H15DRAFT_851013 [Mycena belliarum]|uniref:Uncharacterized protein n=1 Tax=Mycena belliarum TaxID=1033014 RepID=A0AAD6XNY0_9AGAR|nr:hypothetical protein B0H15DRAFT_851013 [Mycena belliae]